MSIKSRKAGVEQIRTGLIGRDIQASRSPWMHEREGAAQGLDLTYTLFDFVLSGRTEDDLGLQLEQAEAEGYSGVNITHPYKQAVIAHLDNLAPSAREIGAVNTVRFGGGERIGHNTDVRGFAESMRSGLLGARMERVVQFGCGGAGAATSHALFGVGVEHLVLIETDTARRDALCDKLRATFGADRVSVAEGLRDVDRPNGIVNTTPCGMAGYPPAAFDPDLLHAHQWVSDIVYFPLETPLLRAARAKGCATLDGSGMAVLQAAAAFEIFTGLHADRERMHRSFLEFVAAPVPA